MAPEPVVERIVALQRAAGNVVVLRLLDEARHVHDASRGHQQSTPVQRSSVPDVLRSSGRPLDDAVRGDMEARLGADFSDVRLHTGIVAERSATEIGARAYTAGSHIVIGTGGADRHTLAHELTHVIQQRQGPVAGTDDGTGLRSSDPSDRFEREAEAKAAQALRPGAVVSGGERSAATDSPRPAGLARSVQRAPDEAAGGGGGGLAAMFKASLGVVRLRSDAAAPQPARKMAVSHIAKVLADSGLEGEETVGSGVMTSIGAIEAPLGRTAPGTSTPSSRGPSSASCTGSRRTTPAPRPPIAPSPSRSWPIGGASTRRSRPSERVSRSTWTRTPA